MAATLMPPVRALRQDDQGIEIDLTYPHSGLPIVIDENGLPVRRLWIPKNGMSLNSVRGRFQALGLADDNAHGFHAEAFPDPNSPNGIAVMVRDRPQSPGPANPSLLPPHNTPYFIDGFEFTDFTCWSTLVGTTSVQTGTLIDGDYTARFGPGSGAGQGSGIYYAYDQDGASPVAALTKEYLTWRCMFTTVPGAKSVIHNPAVTGGTRLSFWINSSGNFGCTDGTTPGNDTTSSAVLSVNTVYTFGWYCEITGAGPPTTGNLSVAVWDANGSLIEQIDLTGVNITDSSWSANMRLGDNCANAANASCGYVYIDSVYSDSAAFKVIRVSKRMFPVGAGTYNDFNTLVPGAGESAYQDVDEIPADGATSYCQSNDGNSSLQNQSFTHGGATAQGGIPVGSTIVGMTEGNVRSDFDTLKGSKTMMYDGTTQQVNTNNNGQAGYAWSWPLFRDVAPDGAAWTGKTLAYLDALEIGHQRRATHFADVRLSTCVLQVAYIPPAPAASAWVPPVMFC